MNERILQSIILGKLLEDNENHLFKLLKDKIHTVEQDHGYIYVTFKNGGYIWIDYLRYPFGKSVLIDGFDVEYTKDASTERHVENKVGYDRLLYLIKYSAEVLE